MPCDILGKASIDCFNYVESSAGFDYHVSKNEYCPFSKKYFCGYDLLLFIPWFDKYNINIHDFQNNRTRQLCNMLFDVEYATIIFIGHGQRYEWLQCG